MKNRLLAALSVALMGVSVFAQESSSFDPATFLSTATTTVGTIVAAVGALLAGALGLYLAFVGYRKAREALNKA